MSWSTGSRMTFSSQTEPAKGKLSVEFASQPGGRTFISRQYFAYPFHVCRPFYHDAALPGLATLYVQSCSGGLYENDRLMIDLEAAPLTEAHVTSQASTIVHGMNGGTAEHDVRIIVGNGAYIEYLPDPQILFPSSRLESTLSVSLSGSGVAVVCESFLAHDPEGAQRRFASFESTIAIKNEVGKELAVDRIVLDGKLSGAGLIGIDGCFGAQGTFIVAGLSGSFSPLEASLKSIQFPYPKATLGVSNLPNSAGLIVRILADDGVTLRLALDRAWSAARQALKGNLPSPKRK